MERDGASSSESEGGEEHEEGPGALNPAERKPKAYDPEQEQLRRSFLRAAEVRGRVRNLFLRVRLGLFVNGLCLKSAAVHQGFDVDCEKSKACNKFLICMDCVYVWCMVLSNVKEGSSAFLQQQSPTYIDVIHNPCILKNCRLGESPPLP